MSVGWGSAHRWLKKSVVASTLGGVGKYLEVISTLGTERYVETKRFVIICRNPAMTTEIPVWMDGRCRWVSGICRKTTVNDVLTALLRAETASTPESAAVPTRPVTPSSTTAPDPSGYVIVERWRGVERRLDGRVRIFKVWMAWADAQSDVQFLVRRVAERSKRRCRRSASSTAAGVAAASTTVSNADSQDHARANDEIERLMCLILRQGETIQNQLRRLRDRETLIERLEGETHAARVAALGANYVLAAYLGDETEEGAPGAGGTREGSGGEGVGGGGGCGVIEADDTRRRIALWEKVVKVNRRLQEQEERLVRLHVDLRRFAEERDTAAALGGALRRAQAESDAGRRDLAASGGLLADAEILLAAKRRLLRRLQSELEAADTEATRLAAIAASQCALPPQPPPLPQQRTTTHPPASTGKDPDSNSDTGLSSLHSSSEEGVCILDTLV